ncbi:ThuA domain-containing protein [Planctomicrobium sp. SH661]|uniref:ThuA domain-containing protein n=1 Tax=Planctomicrobium sp. SH661 TaxID=3448124 RepID=UPI003F5C6A62
MFVPAVRNLHLLVLSAFLLSGSNAAFAADPEVKPIRALLVLGGCCHDYATQKDLLSKGISARAHVEVDISYNPDSTTKQLNPIYEKPNWAEGYDVIIHDECTSDVTDLELIDRILEPHRQGLPGVVLHCGMHSYRSAGHPDITPWFEFTGLQTTGHGPQVPIAIEFTDEGNPITAGMENWVTVNEELYNNSAGKLLDTAKALAGGTQEIKGNDGETSDVTCTVIWTNNYNDGTKVFATTLGHNNQTVGDPRYLDLVTRGLLWSCGKLEPKYLKTPESK